VNNALIAIAGTAEPCTKNMCVNIIGEKNLEYEVEENYAELVRLLSMLGIAVKMRFVHNLAFDRINSLGAAQLNILRDTSLTPVGEYLQQRFGTPFIASFPLGFSGTLSFIGNVAGACGMNGQRAIDEERALQEEIIADFSDLYGSPASFDNTHTDSDGAHTAQEAALELRMNIGKLGCGPLLPVTPAVGTAGVRRMFHRWRRAVHA
jgi:nitrogenase molybdenum-iron protein alpha/beta subunit